MLTPGCREQSQLSLLLLQLPAEVLMRGNAKILLNMHSPDTGFVVWTLGVSGAFWGGFAVWRVALASSHAGQSI